MQPTWGPPESCRPQLGPMLAPWTLLSGICIYLYPPGWLRWDSDYGFIYPLTAGTYGIVVTGMDACVTINTMNYCFRKTYRSIGKKMFYPFEREWFWWQFNVVMAPPPMTMVMTMMVMMMMNLMMMMMMVMMMMMMMVMLFGSGVDAGYMHHLKARTGKLILTPPDQEWHRSDI